MDGGVNWTELSEKLNPRFNWEGAIRDVLGMDISINEVMHRLRISTMGRVYVSGRLSNSWVFRRLIVLSKKLVYGSIFLFKLNCTGTHVKTGAHLLPVSRY